MFRTIFFLELCQVTHLQDEKLRWPLMIVKLRKGQNYSKISKTIAKNLAKIRDIKIFKTISLSEDTNQYPYTQL